MYLRPVHQLHGQSAEPGYEDADESQISRLISELKQCILHLRKPPPFKQQHGPQSPEQVTSMFNSGEIQNQQRDREHLESNPFSRQLEEFTKWSTKTAGDLQKMVDLLHVGVEKKKLAEVFAAFGVLDVDGAAMRTAIIVMFLNDVGKLNDVSCAHAFNCMRKYVVKSADQLDEWED
jgi:hypothetical protein